MMMKILESKFQSKAINHLQKNGWFVLKIIRCNLPGFTDTFLVKNKRVIFIEFKREGESARPLQEFRHEQLRGQGLEVYTVATWEEFIELKL